MTTHANQVTLFVVEDDDVDYIAIQRSLQHLKILNPLVRATDGQEALEMLQSKSIQHPFIMLLDLQMPRMTGLELLSTIRNNSDFKDTIVFILTTSDDESDIVASYQHNVAGYFVKDEVDKEFFDVISLLDGYWQIVHLPGNSESNQ